jgi:DNA cross-link repair 1A protein
MSPQYCFPPQSEVISACADLARKIVLRSDPESLDNSESKEQTMNDMWGKVDNLDGRNKSETKVLIVVG